MSRRIPPIARIRLARSLPRLLAWPLLLVLAGSLSAAAWLFGPVAAGPAGIALAGASTLVVLIGLGIAVVLLTVRLEVAESAVRVSWLGGERVYPLIPGPVTRVRFRGPNASRLRSRPGLLGWGMGTARLRGDEEIGIVRLAPTPTAILVPTERGRLAIAPADEDELLDALSRAARARQRLEELGPPPGPVATEVEPAPEPEAVHEPEPEPALVLDSTLDVEPHLLTGIERALLEQRLGAERAAGVTEPEPPPEAEAADLGVAEPGTAEAGAALPPTPTVEPAVGPAIVPRRRGLLRVRRPLPSAAIILLPIVGAGAVWGAGILLGRLPSSSTELGRLTSLALVLSGPATSVGAIMARVWWPRIVGVVVVSGLAASLFVGRALLGF
jgi:hypothetical protein